jgi:hypothetical protein
MFVLHDATRFLVLLVYVDDVLLTGNSEAAINDVKQFLHAQFSIKDLGALNYFLGLEVSATPSGLFLGHAKYARDILRRAGMTDASPVPYSVIRLSIGLCLASFST